MFSYSKPKTKRNKTTLDGRKMAELNAKPLDEMDDRRIRAEQRKGSFGGQYNPSFHHFYNAAELDHGNNDRRASTFAYKTVEHLIDDNEPYEPDEEDKVQLEEMLRNELALLDQQALAARDTREESYAMPRSCEQFRNRLRSIKIVLISYGGQYVPYTSPKLQAAIKKR